VEEACRVSELIGYAAHDRQVVLPFALQRLVAAFPDWVESSEDGTILGWLYLVLQPDGPDQWARQAITDPFPLDA
jgi:hypothetical protein